MDQNPFRHQDPIRDRDVFFNRDVDVRKVLNKLRNGQSVAVFGKEKVGKTWFLHHVSDPQVAAGHGLMLPKHLFCYVDCKQWAVLDDDGCLDHIRAVLEEAISAWEACPFPAPEGTAYSDAHYWLDQTLNLFDRADIQLTLQLDHFDRRADNGRLTHNLLDKLRSLNQGHDTMTYLTTSRKPLVDLKIELSRTKESPFFGIFRNYELGPFDSDETRRFLETRFGSVVTVRVGSVLEFVSGLSGDEPHCLQLACACAYDVWCEKGKEELCDGDCGEIEERFGQELKAACGDST